MQGGDHELNPRLRGYKRQKNVLSAPIFFDIYRVKLHSCHELSPVDPALIYASCRLVSRQYAGGFLIGIHGHILRTLDIRKYYGTGHTGRGCHQRSSLLR